MMNGTHPAPSDSSESLMFQSQENRETQGAAILKARSSGKKPFKKSGDINMASHIYSTYSKKYGSCF
jgi:hypothetical protein